MRASEGLGAKIAIPCQKQPLTSAYYKASFTPASGGSIPTVATRAHVDAHALSHAQTYIYIHTMFFLRMLRLSLQPNPSSFTVNT